MNPVLNAFLGLTFLGLSIAGTVLMYWLWGFPYDHEKYRSKAPPFLMAVHRIIGYLYVTIYIIMMWQMFPRLWNYQIEFSPRSSIHLSLGFLIGGILFLKFLVVRFFKHLESRLAPIFGTLLMLSTLLLVGLSVPMAFKEYQLRKSVAGGDIFSSENIDRMNLLISRANFPEDAPRAEMSDINFLLNGRKVLLSKCVQCHDLRIVLLKPRTPANWANTVRRMSERTVASPISSEEQWWVTAYLIALSPELQRGFKSKMEEDMALKEISFQIDLDEKTPIAPEKVESFRLREAKAVYELKCSGCHFLSNVENNPPQGIEDLNSLVSRMITNGLDASREEISKIIFYLSDKYVK